MRTKLLGAVLGMAVMAGCGRGERGKREDRPEPPPGSSASDHPAPTHGGESAKPDDANDAVAMCDGLVPRDLRGGAKLAGERFGRMLTCKLERDGNEEQQIHIECSGKHDVADFKRMGGGLEQLAIGRAAYKSPFGGVHVLLGRADCTVTTFTSTRAEELARAIDAALGPDHPLVASGRLECARLVPETLRQALGATAKLEQESVLEGTVSCALERPARGQLESAAMSTRTVVKVDYTCREDVDPEQAMEERRGRRGHEAVAIGRGGYFDGKRTIVFIDGQAPCIVDVELREATKLSLEQIATELEAALTADAVGK